MCFAFLISGLVTAKTYNAPFSKGSNTYMVSKYDEDKWNEIIGHSITPDNLFGGNADKKNAKAKKTNLGWYNNETSVYEMLTGIYLPEDYLPSLFKLEINRSTINEDYKTTIPSWKIYQSLWCFTEEDFEVDPDIQDYILYLFKNPEDYKTGLDIYHQWIDEINSTYELTFPNLTGDDFIWQLVLKGQYFPMPINNYLETLVNSLDCENVKTDENALIIERNAEKLYTVKIIYTGDGSYSHIEIRDKNGVIFYQVLQDNPHRLFTWILLGTLIAVFSMAFIYRSFKLKRRRE